MQENQKRSEKNQSGIRIDLWKSIENESGDRNPGPFVRSESKDGHPQVKS
jgi:hypothetical protein